MPSPHSTLTHTPDSRLSVLYTSTVPRAARLAAAASVNTVPAPSGVCTALRAAAAASAVPSGLLSGAAIGGGPAHASPVTGSRIPAPTMTRHRLLLLRLGLSSTNGSLQHPVQTNTGQCTTRHSHHTRMAAHCCAGCRCVPVDCRHDVMQSSQCGRSRSTPTGALHAGCALRFRRKLPPQPGTQQQHTASAELT